MILTVFHFPAADAVTPAAAARLRRGDVTRQQPVSSRYTSLVSPARCHGERAAAAGAAAHTASVCSWTASARRKTERAST